MKIFKSTSIMLAIFLLFGVNVEASTPKVIVTESGEVQVNNAGNNITGIEVTLQLSSGSFADTAFTATTGSSYTFEKVSGNKITIYSTGQEDLASDGTVILGAIKTTADAAFSSGTTVNIIDQSLVRAIYANVTVVNEMNTDTSTTGSSTGSSDDNGNDASSLTDDDEPEVLIENEEDVELYLEDSLDVDDYSSANENVAYSEENERKSLYLWLCLLILVLTGGRTMLYMNKPKGNKPKDNKPKDNEPKNDDHIMDEIIDEMPLAQKEYNDLYVNAEYEGTDMTQYQEW